MPKRIAFVTVAVCCSLLVGFFCLWFFAERSKETVISRPPKVPTEADVPTALPDVDEIVRVVGGPAGRCPGAVVVGLIDHKKQLVLGWGKDCAGRPANGDTVFETASISKALTGLVLAQLVERGDLKLEDDVLSYSDCEIPCCGAQPMNILNLATHSSGFPPWPDNRGDTGAPYSSEDLRRYLRTANLLGPPGEGICYSNTAFALLSDLLSNRAGMSFEQLLQKTICRPLGMTHTHIGLSKSERKRLAVGHWATGETAAPSSPTASGGADGVRSTVHDLLKLLSAYIGIKSSPLDSALTLSYQEFFTFDENRNSGLGWFIDHTDGTVQKHGLIAGYRTSIAFSPESRVGVVVLSGWEKFPAPEVGRELLNAMMRKRAEQLAYSVPEPVGMRTIRCSALHAGEKPSTATSAVPERLKAEPSAASTTTTIITAPVSAP